MSPDIDPIEKLKEAKTFAESDIESELLVTRKLKDGPEVKKIGIKRELQSDIAKITVDSLSRHIGDVEGGQVRMRPLDVGNTVAGGSIIQWEHTDNVPDTSIFRILNSRTDDGSTKYGAEPKPDFHFVRICEPRGPILIGLQTHSDFTSVDTTTEVAITDNSEGYEKVQDDLLILKPRFSAICYDGWLFVTKPKTFESVFELREKYVERGQEVINTLSDSGITFADDGKIDEWLLGNIYMLRGMYEISQYDIHNQLTPDTVRRWIDKYNLGDRHSIDYDWKGGEIQLSIEEYKNTWGVLSLLSGKFAEDDIMGTQWEIDAGERL